MGRVRSRSLAVSVLFATVFLLPGSVSLFADSLAPVAVGGGIDSSPEDGLADVLSTAPFIANVSGGQYRAIVEYDLTGIPSGTVLAANISGRVVPNNSVDTGLREHLVEVYTGNGGIDLIDYSIPGIEVGRFSHASGDSTDFDFDFTGVLHNLLAAGAEYLGMRITPLSETLPFDILSTSEFVNPPRINFEVLPTGSQTVQFLPTFDVNVTNNEGTFVLEEGELSIGVQKIDFANIDRRGVLEYDISSVPENAIITDAKITFDVRGFSGGAGDQVEAPIYGYSGDGVVQIADAFETTNPIGILGPVDSLDPITVDIDHAFIESLLGSSDFFGIAILGDPDFNSVTFAALEFNESPFFIPPALLHLTYTVPQVPGDFDEDGDVDEVDLSTWQASFGQNDGADSDGDGDSDGLDFLSWQKNFAGPDPLASVQKVPEPSSLMISVIVGTILLRVRVPQDFSNNVLSA